MSEETANVAANETAKETARLSEASLYDDPASADLSAKLTQAWLDFRGALAAFIKVLPTGARLEVTLDPSASGVVDAVYTASVTPSDGGLLSAFAVGNALLPAQYRLSMESIGKLAALGWLPSGAPGERRLALQAPAEQTDWVAGIVSRTLREVYGTPHPAFLVYAIEGAPSAHLPGLGGARLRGEADPVPGAGDLAGLSLGDKVSTVVAAMLNTTPDKLQVDADGDIGIRSGSAMVFVRERDEPPLVDVFSPILTQVKSNERLYVRLSELTSRMPIGRLYWSSDAVWASVPVFGRDFQASHLMLAVQVMTGLADELDDRLQREFGGRRFFTDPDAPDDGSGSGAGAGGGAVAAAPPAEERIGPYL